MPPRALHVLPAAAASLLHVLAAASLLALACADSDGLARRPLRGWNSWNWIGTSGCSDRCEAAGMAGRCHSEVMMRQMTDALASSKLPALDFEYINLSEGWPAQCFRTKNCTGRFANGTIRHDPDRVSYFLLTPSVSLQSACGCC